MPSPHYEALRDVAQEAARRAGAELECLFHLPRQTREKGLRDIVTDADLLAERIVIETIRRHYPDHTILSEESGESAGVAGQQWIIDPLDGTTNYARGIPYFCVAVAVAEAGRPVAGAVYDPLREAMYHAARGGGAFCNTRRLQVSERRRMLDLLLMCDWPRADAPRAEVMRMAQAAGPLVGGLRTLGSAALELCTVAEGASDGYFHLTLHLWDMAAPALIIEEAGGRITAIDGVKPWSAGQTCLATNGLIHDELAALLAAARERAHESD